MRAERSSRARRRLLGAAAVAAAGLLVAACSSSSSSTGGATTSTSAGSSTASASAASTGSSSGQVTIGVDLTYNNTAFWAAYINYEQQYAAQMHIKLLGPLLAAANASLQNQQIENLVNEGAQAIVVNPETATSLGPAITYATAHHVQLVSVDTIVGVGKVYMVVRASNTLYGQDACAYISSQVKSGYVLDLEGDLTSSNGADRTNAFDSCMAANDPARQGAQGPDRLDRRHRRHRRAERDQRLRLPAQGHLLPVVQPGHRHHPAAEEQGPRPRLGAPGDPDQR